MRIVEYDETDPFEVLNVTVLALDFPFTPQRAQHLRQTDLRPFPCLSVCALEDGMVIGQVGIFRLPVVTIEGREEVGGVWAVSTHPQYAGRGVASRLLEAAHERMRLAGLRFSTLGTSRYRSAYKLYQRLGYEDTKVWATALAPRETARQPTRLRAQPPGPGGYDLLEQVFDKLASNGLGFAWRPKPFTHLRERVSLEEAWILWDHDRAVGYILAQNKNKLLNIHCLLLREDTDAAEAVAAVSGEMNSDYVQVKANRPADITSLRRAGYHVAHPDWGAFMVKALVPEVTVETARHLMGMGTDRFLISWLDVT